MLEHIKNTTYAGNEQVAFEWEYYHEKNKSSVNAWGNIYIYYILYVFFC